MPGYRECIICLPSPSETRIKTTRDHIIPRVAARDYPNAFDGVYGKNINFVKLCAEHHSIIDDNSVGKIGIYREGGLTGLVLYLAHYPRCSDPEFWLEQYEQWNGIFDQLHNNFRDLSRISGKSQEKYDYLSSLTEQYRSRWQQIGVNGFIESGFRISPDGRDLIVTTHMPELFHLESI